MLSLVFIVVFCAMELGKNGLCPLIWTRSWILLLILVSLLYEHGGGREILAGAEFDLVWAPET